MLAEAASGSGRRANARRRVIGARPATVAVTALVFHAIWIGAFFAAGHEVRDFIKIGPQVVRSSHASSVIRYDPTYSYPLNHDVAHQGQGFDGQYYYFMALDPANAHYYMAGNDPAYRYERIFYPMLSRALAFGKAKVVPWTMLLINWLAVGAGVLALAAWLRRRDTSPWFALLYGVFPGMIIALQRDLTEPLAYGLVASAIYLFDFGGRRGVLWSGAVFGLAALTRETALLFALLFGLSILFGRPNASRPGDRSARVREMSAFLALSAAPLAAWLAWDWGWLGLPTASRGDLTAIPFGGAFETPFKLAAQPVDLVFVVLPAVLSAAVVGRYLQRRPRGTLERICLLANAAFIIVFASGFVWVSYTSIGRVSIAIVLAALLCLPYLPLGSLRDRATVAMISAATLWLVLIPGVLVYGFSDIKV